MDLSTITNRFVSRDINPDGYEETNVTFRHNGREIQIVNERGSRYCTVFVDGTPSEMRRDEVESFLDGVEP